MITEESNKENKVFYNGFCIISTIVVIFLWIHNTNKYVEKGNELCRNGLTTHGVIYKIEDNHLNEGNIHSWDVFYSFQVDSIRYTGQTNESKNKILNINDSINILYSIHNPKIHQASLSEIKNECTSFSLALFKFDNYYIIIIGLTVLIVFLRIN